MPNREEKTMIFEQLPTEILPTHSTAHSLSTQDTSFTMYSIVLCMV